MIQDTKSGSEATTPPLPRSSKDQTATTNSTSRSRSRASSSSESSASSSSASTDELFDNLEKITLKRILPSLPAGAVPISSTHIRKFGALCSARPDLFSQSRSQSLANEAPQEDPEPAAMPPPPPQPRHRYEQRMRKSSDDGYRSRSITGKEGAPVLDGSGFLHPNEIERRSRERLKRAQMEHNREYTFHPSVWSSVQADNNAAAPWHSRLHDDEVSRREQRLKERDQRRQEMQLQRSLNETRECSFHPTVVSTPRGRTVSSTQWDASSNGSVYHRLYKKPPPKTRRGRNPEPSVTGQTPRRDPTPNPTQQRLYNLAMQPLEDALQHGLLDEDSPQEQTEKSTAVNRALFERLHSDRARISSKKEELSAALAPSFHPQVSPFTGHMFSQRSPGDVFHRLSKQQRH